MATKNLGPVTAYAYAREHGYTGTEEEFEALMGGLPSAVTGAQAAVETVTGLTAQATKVSATSPAKATYNKTTNKIEFEIPEGNGITSITLAGTSGNIKTYTINFDDGTTTNFEVSDGEITLEYAEENLAYNNGYYEDLTAGSADQLVSTQTHEDEELYTFRTSGGSVDISNRETDKLVGGTVAWNQLIKNGDFSDGKTNWGGDSALITAADGVAAVTVLALVNSQGLFQGGISVSNGHKYLLSADFKFPYSNVTVVERIGSVMGTWAGHSETANTWCTLSTIRNATAYLANGAFELDVDARTQFSVNDVYYVRNCCAFDLTQMFGPTIADALYEMEQAEAGSGVAWFKKYFPKPYYAYDAGSLQSVNVASHDMVEFNAFDKSTVITGKWFKDDYSGEVQNVSGYNLSDFIKVCPNSTYYKTETGSARNLFYDADKNVIGSSWAAAGFAQIFTIPSNAHYIRLTITDDYLDSACINLSWSGWRNGEYAKYVKHSYPYDETVELRGIPQLVDGKLVYDGDTYEADGTVNRKYGIAVMDGSTNDYAAWPTPSDPYIGFAWYGIQPTIKDDRVYGMPVNQGFISENSNLETRNVYAVSTVVYITIEKSALAGTNVSDFKAWLADHPITLVYPLATPTTETTTGFTNPQVVDDFGTEEYVDAGVKNGTRDVAIPVGHVTYYMQNLRDKLQHLPTLSEEDGDFFIRQKDKQMSLKKLEGEFDDLTAGNAKQLVSTVTVDDAVPYIFRTSGGSVDIGNRAYIDSIVGGTVAFNQQLKGNDFASTTNFQGVNATLSASDGILTFTNTKVPTVEYDNRLVQDTTNRIIEGHKYILCATIKSSRAVMVQVALTGSTTANSEDKKIIAAADRWEERYGLFNPISATHHQSQIYYSDDYANVQVGDTLQVKDWYVIDLTQMFGSTIADYIYSLEQANAGAGVAFFKSLFPKPYYAYNAGELMSVRGLVSHDMVGFNVWDEEWEHGYFSITDGRFVADDGRCCSKNFIQVVPNAGYYINSSNQTIWVLEYDADKNYYGVYKMGRDNVITFSDECRYLQFYTLQDYGNTYKNDICINLSWSGTHDGEYEAYRKVSYPLDSSLELRGIPKLDASNNLYYDGDTYEADGTVTRKYGIHTFDGTETFGVTPLDEFTQVSWTEYLDFGAANGSFMSDRFVQSGTQGGVGTMWNSSVPRLFIGLPATVTTQAEAKQWFINNPTTVVYPLAEPTTELADPYTSPQMVNDWGTEEFVIDNTIEVPIPVGHNTRYPANLRDKLQHLPDLADNDGYYMMKQTGAEMSLELFRIPKAPSTNGKYHLTATVSGGTPTYVWEEVTE